MNDFHVIDTENDALKKIATEKVMNIFESLSEIEKTILQRILDNEQQ